MGCLTISQIYLYIENELASDEIRKIKNHLSWCAKCRDMVEERRVLVQAAETLPQFKLPPNFTEQVMANIFPSRIPFRVWIRATAGGLSAMIFAFFLFYIFSGKNLADLFISINKFSLPALRTLSTGIVKTFKLLWYLIKIIAQFFDFALKSFGKLTTILSPEIQIGIVTLTLIASTLIFLTVRKKLMFGEKA
ncbi:MAG: zf-HC2 domain-containing protein [Candidatus Aminicenantes bacterium]|nr:zf-HC2 domain-containing protein [Candidatus Aminicenantes bacterium]